MRGKLGLVEYFPRDTSVLDGVFDFYIRKKSYKKYRICFLCGGSKEPKQKIQLRLNYSDNKREMTRYSTVCATH